MKLSSLFITRAGNLRQYPSFLSRMLFCIFPAFAVLNFDYMDSGRSIADGNYWMAKGIVFLCTLGLVEYIYRIHLRCSRRFGRGGQFLKVVFHQFLLAVMIPELFIWQLLRIAGITYLPYMASVESPNAGSVAMIHETLGIFNITFLACYLNMPQLFLANGRKNHKDIWIVHFGHAEKIKTDTVLFIIHRNGVNFLMTEYLGVRKLMSDQTPEELLKTLPPGDFELRGDGLFRKEINQEKEGLLRDYVDNYFRTRTR